MNMIPPSSSRSTDRLDKQKATKRPRKLLAQLREELRSRHYSKRTENRYVVWIRRFILFHNLRHPEEMSEVEVNEFLTHLAVKQDVAAPTQDQALSALLFLYRYIFRRELGELGNVIRARRAKRLPVVLTRDEVKAVFSQLKGEQRLIAILMYGTGMRLMECLRLRVKDIDSVLAKYSFVKVREIKIGAPCCPTS